MSFALVRNVCWPYLSELGDLWFVFYLLSFASAFRSAVCIFVEIYGEIMNIFP